MTKQDRHPERPWATGVLVMAGAISLSFNTVHSWHTDLAPPLALLFGAGPVTLAAMQSHVVALQASRGELVGVWRKLGTFSLVVGALALSFLGIYDLLNEQVADPITGTEWNEPAVLTPVVVDLMAIAALTELLRPAKRTTTDRQETTARPAGTGQHGTTAPEPAPTAPERPVVTTPSGGLPTARPATLATADGHLLGPVDRAPTDHNDHPGQVPGDHTAEPVNDQPSDRPTTTPNDHTNNRPADTKKTARRAPRTTARQKTERPVETKKTRRPTPEENTNAVAAYKASCADGRPLSERQLADQFGRSKGWARDRIREAGPQVVVGRERPVETEGGRPGGTTTGDRPSDHRDDQSNDRQEATG
jgi:hypothetical protein